MADRLTDEQIELLRELAAVPDLVGQRYADATKAALAEIEALRAEKAGMHADREWRKGELCTMVDNYFSLKREHDAMLALLGPRMAEVVKRESAEAAGGAT